MTRTTTAVDTRDQFYRKLRKSVAPTYAMKSSTWGMHSRHCSHNWIIYRSIRVLRTPSDLFRFFNKKETKQTGDRENYERRSSQNLQRHLCCYVFFSLWL